MKIIDISFAFLTLLFNFVFRMRRARQVSAFIKYLLNLENTEVFCFILHRLTPGGAFCEVRERNIFKPF
jgi:hypothetical protein